MPNERQETKTFDEATRCSESLLALFSGKQQLGLFLKDENILLRLDNIMLGNRAIIHNNTIFNYQIYLCNGAIVLIGVVNK